MFTNGGASLALRNATEAARILGEPAPAQWLAIAENLRMPFDETNQIFSQYDGYNGSQQIKQADTVLLIYPLEWPMSNQVASNTLDFYAERSDPDGPAMTDAMHAVDSAQIGEPGCATNTYLNRSIKPFVRDPFAQYVEARGDKAGAQDPLAGSPALNFTTGSGGFAQVFLYGLTGFRWRADHVQLDPMLPPQLSGGVTLTGLSLARADLRRPDRRHDDDRHASLGPRDAGPIARRRLLRRQRRLAQPLDPQARPRADQQPGALPARHGDLRGPGHVRRGRGRRQRRDRLGAGRRGDREHDRGPRPAREGEDHRGPPGPTLGPRRGASRPRSTGAPGRRRPTDASGKLRNPTSARYVRVTLTRPGEELTGVREIAVTG